VVGNLLGEAMRETPPVRKNAFDDPNGLGNPSFSRPSASATLGCERIVLRQTALAVLSQRCTEILVVLTARCAP
jgi:hypothetical protein